ncbi:MAG: transglutaminase family protein, partial [Fimbriimonadales bacterium]
TALTVMCQYAGLPARAVSGYLLRDPDPDTGEYIVREADRHLWTEVYFDGIGWVAFDATENAPVADGSETTLGSASADASQRRNWQRWLIDSAIALGLVYLLYLVGSSWRLRNAPTLITRKHAETYHKLAFTLQVAGVSAPAPHETPSAFLQRAQSALRGSQMETVLKNLQELLPAYLFGASEQARDLTPTVQEQIREFERAFRQEIPLTQRTVRTVQLYWRKLNGDIA